MCFHIYKFEQLLSVLLKLVLNPVLVELLLGLSVGPNPPYFRI